MHLGRLAPSVGLADVCVIHLYDVIIINFHAGGK